MTIHPLNTPFWGVSPLPSTGTARPVLLDAASPLWIISSTFRVHKAMQHSPAPPTAVPPPVPFSAWPLWPVLCDSTVSGPHVQVAMAMTLEGLSRSATHTHTHCGKEGDRYSIIRRGVLGGRVERWELHCSELTAETRGKLERGWVCFSLSDRKCVQDRDCVCLRERQRRLFVIWLLSHKLFGFFTYKDLS